MALDRQAPFSGGAEQSAGELFGVVEPPLRSGCEGGEQHLLEGRRRRIRKTEGGEGAGELSVKGGVGGGEWHVSGERSVEQHAESEHVVGRPAAVATCLGWRVAWGA